MKKTLLFVLILIYLNPARGQDFFFRNSGWYSSFSQKKIESQLARNRFVHTGGRIVGDTMLAEYTYKTSKKDKDSTVKRMFEILQVKNEFQFRLLTNSNKEFSDLVTSLKKEGFFCGIENGEELLYQKEEITVTTDKRVNHGDTFYSIHFKEEKLPGPGDLQNAEDLMQIRSHEHLVAVFGKENVVKDIYQFSETESSRSSVVFPKTRHQAVFVWEDELNYRDPYYIILGGNIQTENFTGYNGVIEENAWLSRDGVYSGMSLADLVRLNGADLKFYGINTAYPFMILPNSAGKLGHKQMTIVLACLDNSSLDLLENEIVSAAEVLQQNPGMYVFMLLLKPGIESSNTDQLITSNKD